MVDRCQTAKINLEIKTTKSLISCNTKSTASKISTNNSSPPLCNQIYPLAVSIMLFIDNEKNPKPSPCQKLLTSIIYSILLFTSSTDSAVFCSNFKNNTARSAINVLKRDSAALA